MYSLDSKVYYDGINKKPLLYKGLKNKVPKEVFEMPKSGFSFQNISNLFDIEFENLLEGGLLVENNIIKNNIDFKKLSPLVKFHLLMLEFWFQNHS